MEYSGQNRVAAPQGMQKGPITKYRPYPLIDLPNRQWPARTLSKAPIWCSVDLRDGNQALPTPMGIEEKMEMFKLLVGIGFKEIEVGFPSASQIDFDFIRRLINENLIPDDVAIQVITQAREELIQRTFESIRGAKNVIFHLYNSTSEQQRRIVFGMSRAEIIAIATNGTRLVKELLSELPGTHFVYQYSPESFALTEIDFGLEICEAVVDVWQPTPENKIILNLPETVQVSTPNIHADQIEWIATHLRRRDTAIISLHTHNDRGTGVATTELGLLAGGERVEGTLFGNGERTGNVDIITVALNMYMQGIDPGLDFSNLDAIRVVYERCTHMTVPARQPYGGELVFTAFSGSHQDAIRKGMNARDTAEGALWDVPYLPIDPQDIGRSYEAIIRINSQSGKGGVAFILESEFNLQMPKEMHIEFGKVIKSLADATGEELSGVRLRLAFEQEYLHAVGPYELEHFQAEPEDDSQSVSCTARLRVEGVARTIRGQGNGPIDAFVQALNQHDLAAFKLASYTEHSLSAGSDSQAAAYIQIETGSRRTFFGAAIENNSELAAVKAVLSALNRSESALALAQKR
ncbi:MAG TPA: 2-isopropylmalate synthase [Ktedonobacteraceae bacterium]|nr:2-isopropylmalate synthase [Ktedonobacteraceae bacterium]